MKLIQFFTGFFQEDGGTSSMMRLCFFISTLGLVGLSFYIQSTESGWNAYNAAMVASSFGLIFGAKAWQRKQEAKEYVEEVKAASQENIQEKQIQSDKEIQQGITAKAEEVSK